VRFGFGIDGKSVKKPALAEAGVKSRTFIASKPEFGSYEKPQA